MKQRILCLLLAVGLSGLSCLEAQAEKPAQGDRMNVLFLVADDLNSWLLGDEDRYAGKVIAPHLRKLAESGVNFTLHASDAFRGKSERGRYGDVIEELDWSVGEILKTLMEQGLEENTFVILTSDNGHQLVFRKLATVAKACCPFEL